MRRKALGMILLAMGLTLSGCGSLHSDKEASFGIQKSDDDQDKEESDKNDKDSDKKKKDSKKDKEETSTEETTETEETSTEDIDAQSTGNNPNKEIYDQFFADEKKVFMYDKERTYSEIEEEDEIEKTVFYDVDNDGEDELVMYSINYYPMMIFDVEDSEIVVFAAGEGTAGYLFLSEVDGETWLCHSDTTHVGRQMYWFSKYNGFDNEVDSFNLSAEYWESEVDQYDEDSTFTYREDSITMEEFEELRDKYTENIVL